MFRLEGVKYKDILNVDNLNIEKNKITAILGESGSGKSTLLKLLNNMIEPCEGTIFYNNDNINELDPINLRRRVIMLPQTPVIFEGSIKDNLLIGLRFSKKELVSDDELNKVLRMINLSKKLDDNAENLSGGEKQRLTLGRVILMNPDVYLLDEPSSALDDNTEDFILEKLIEYTNDKDTTIIIVTHSKNVASKYSDHIIKISKGRIINE